jgi:O-antigen ligase
VNFSKRFARNFWPSISLTLFFGMCASLWIAGGASRGDVSGQIVIRGVSWLVLLCIALFGPRPTIRGNGPAFSLILCAFILVALQLIPLPPSVWAVLPGRQVLMHAATAAGEAQPWRPWSIVPGATWNALQSLIVPFTVIILLAGLKPSEQAWVPKVLLCLVTLSALVGLAQFTGMIIANPLINDSPGQVSGSFANRNHFALFVSIGFLLVPVWTFPGGRRAHWRGPVAIGLILMFALVILATGSRAGILVGILALCVSLILAYNGLKRELRRAQRWVLPALLSGLVATIAIFVIISIGADRATSINRAVAVAAEGGEDMRWRALPTVLAMIQTYFPAGAGFGTFDPLFRMHEPFALLKMTYFNHAHNDLLELLIEGGLGSLLLMLAALAWWLVASIRAWRAGPSQMLPRLGSAIIMVILIASVFDYPARTPIIMAVIVIAATWLGGARRPEAASALPNDAAQL